MKNEDKLKSIRKRKKKAFSLSKEAEEYLEAMYRLEEKYGYIRTMDLARKLNVVPGSVTNTIENFEKIGFVIHMPYKGIKLTMKGRKIALKILRKHRLSERLLTDILKMDLGIVHDEACVMEHGITEQIAEKIERILDNPKTCPHGRPIPDSSGKMIKEYFETLEEVDPGKIVKIIGFEDERKEILTYLLNIGIVPNALIQIVYKNHSNIHLEIKSIGKKYTINRYIASNILAKPIEA